MTNNNFNTIINRFKLSPNEDNYQIAVLALLMYKVKWQAFCHRKTPQCTEIVNDMLPVVIKHGDPQNNESLLIVAGENTYQLSPGYETTVYLEAPETRITLMSCIYTPGEAEIKTHEFEGADAGDDSTPILDDLTNRCTFE
jgi:hypothetical protein